MTARQNAMPKVSRPGISMSPCFFANWPRLRACVRLATGLAITCGKLSHLGLRNAPAKSTLSYANAHHPWTLYQDVCFHLRDFCRSESPGKKKKFSFQEQLLSLDSTTVDLCLSLFPLGRLPSDQRRH